ncbi:GNAT family N-acetyltransferase [Flectobacillus major]|jgi:ribosomal protein S18 acetylase RimI-like enzyme|uniref:GNAT family N-acetyltransferase n=1 Tax=Flectobacillus major TaxID=103 RepID=UPI000412E39A|nr:GNAT family N-acetyltransferase [Flectobacillus major]
MHIRQAQTTDLVAVLQLYADVLDKGNVLSLPQAEKLFHKMQSYPNYRVYVAEEASQIVGTFALLIMDNLAHQGTPSGIVEDVAVQVDQQGKGIGKAMMQFAMAICQESGCYKLVLSSNQRRTEAHAFYESLGFERHGFSFQVIT